MSCPANHRLAAASVGEDIEAELHAETCETCRAELAAMASVVELARRAPVPKLTADRRAMLAAMVMAESDTAPSAPQVQPRRFARVAAVVALAAAAIVVVIVWPNRPAPSVASAPETAAPSSPRGTASSSAPRTAQPAPACVEAATETTPTPAPTAPADQVAVATRPPQPTTPLPDGRVTIDARNVAPVRVAAGDTAVQIAASKVEVTARSGVVAMVRVFAGSAEIVHSGQRVVVVAGDVWVRPTGSVDAMRTFEQGWRALRATRYREAIAAFDRANHPVIAEDAAYWAAIAAGRAGARADAESRLHRFMLQFPKSKRLDDARRQLEALGDNSDGTGP